jgi:mono/diheme cytochrome c family protein
MKSARDYLFPNVASGLVWYFSRGAIALERSTSGGMLERAKTFSAPKSQVAFPKVVNGIIRYSEREVTARITAEFRNVGGYEPDGDTLEDAGTYSMKLMRLDRVDRQAAAVIEYVYGDAGSAWEPTHDDVVDGKDLPGRLFALWPYTGGGSRLIAQVRIETIESAVKTSHEATKGKEPGVIRKAADEARRVAVAKLDDKKPIHWLYQEWALQKTRPREARAELMAAAAVEAERLHTAACAAWNEVQRGSVER